MWKRIIFDIVFFSTLLWAPWWIGACIALLGMFFFARYLEAILYFFIHDLLFAPPEISMDTLSFLPTLISIATYIIIRLVKRFLTFYEHI